MIAGTTTQKLVSRIQTTVFYRLNSNNFNTSLVSTSRDGITVGGRNLTGLAKIKVITKGQTGLKNIRIISGNKILLLDNPSEY